MDARKTIAQKTKAYEKKYFDGDFNERNKGIAKVHETKLNIVKHYY